MFDGLMASCGPVFPLTWISDYGGYQDGCLVRFAAMCQNPDVLIDILHMVSSYSVNAFYAV